MASRSPRRVDPYPARAGAAAHRRDPARQGDRGDLPLRRTERARAAVPAAEGLRAGAEPRGRAQSLGTRLRPGSACGVIAAEAARCGATAGWPSADLPNITTTERAVAGPFVDPSMMAMPQSANVLDMMFARWPSDSIHDCTRSSVVSKPAARFSPAAR